MLWMILKLRLIKILPKLQTRDGENDVLNQIKGLLFPLYLLFNPIIQGRHNNVQTLAWLISQAGMVDWIFFRR